MIAVEEGTQHWATAQEYSWWMGPQAHSEPEPAHRTGLSVVSAILAVDLPLPSCSEVPRQLLHPMAVDLDVVDAGVNRITDIGADYDDLSMCDRLTVMASWFSGDPDAITPALADAIIQAGLFGRLVFPPEQATTP